MHQVPGGRVLSRGPTWGHAPRDVPGLLGDGFYLEVYAMWVKSGLVILAAWGCFGASLDKTLDAIRTVETGGRDLVGDSGKAIGPYQVHRECWLDSGVPGRYEDCHDEAYARRVAEAYLRRYAAKAVKDGDSATMARVWNGGPSGAKKKATEGYAAKVLAAIK